MLTANKQTSTGTNTLLNRLTILRGKYLDSLLALGRNMRKPVIYCAAKLINYFHHWTEWKIQTHRTEWIYQPVKEISKDLLGEHSIHVIREAIAFLIEEGFLERRKNPGNGQDRTYQYRLIRSTPQKPSAETFTQSPFVNPESASVEPELSNVNADKYHRFQSIESISTSIDVDNDFEEKEADQEKVVVTEEVTKVIQDEFKEEIVATNENSVEDQFSAAAPSQKFIEETREKLKQFIGGFAPAQDAPKATKQGIKIEGADEETLEVLWRHEGRLQELNVDLSTDRIRQAIVNNPQFLENAIHAFYEASAKGKLTSKEANGYFYNALKQGWKPKQSTSNSSPSIFTAPPEFFEPIVQPTLAELVERKRQMWKTEALRPSITAWTEKTEGVILTADGPALSF